MRLTAGNYDKLRAEGAVSGPLIKNKVMGNFAFLAQLARGLRERCRSPRPLARQRGHVGRPRAAARRIRPAQRAAAVGRLSVDSTGFRSLMPSRLRRNRAASRFDSPASLWEVRTSQLASGKNTQQGASARLTTPLNGTTTLNSLTAYRQSNYRFFFDADATELSAADVRRARPPAPVLGGADARAAHAEAHVDRRRVLLRRTQRRAGRDHRVSPPTQIRPFAKIGTNAWALFGQATYQPVKPRVADGRSRYTDEQKDLDSTGGAYRLGTAILADPDVVL